VRISAWFRYLCRRCQRRNCVECSCASQGSITCRPTTVGCSPASSADTRGLSNSSARCCAASALASQRSKLGFVASPRRLDASNTEWQRDLSVSHNKLGDVAVAAGDVAVAKDHFEISLRIAEQLAALDPGNQQWQKDVQICMQRLINLERGRQNGL